MAQLETMLPSLSRLVALAESGAFGQVGAVAATAEEESATEQGGGGSSGYGAARLPRIGAAGARAAAEPYAQERAEKDRKDD